jgi:orotate phosphoribosyltransferase
MNNASQKVADILLSIKAVTLNLKKPYRYTSGILSPVYTDCRLLMGYPKERKEVAEFFKEVISQEDSFDVIAGTATAGIPHAAWVADSMALPMVYVRSKPKEHGKGNQIEGVLGQNQKVAVVEDLISTAKSSAETIQAIRASGCTGDIIFSIITYNLVKSEETLKENKIKLVSLTNLAQLAKSALEKKYISEKDVEAILEWAKDPISWGNRMGFE